MSIYFDKNNNVFNISTPNTSYLMGLYKDEYLIHLYYGKKISGTFAIDDVFEYAFSGYCMEDFSAKKEKLSYEFLPKEFSCFGGSDTREPALNIRYADGSSSVDLKYAGYKITKGKPKLSGLPAFYTEQDSEADTLEIELSDAIGAFKVILSYTAYNNYDIITRNVKIVNTGTQKLELLRLMSMCIDFQDNNYDFIHLWGTWASERKVQRISLMNGNNTISSRRGGSSHQHNPFFALARKDTNELSGDVYGFGLVYSGNFVGGTDVNHNGNTRAYMGLNDFNFKWILNAGDEFQAPEVVMTYSDCGLSKMSQQFHRAIRKRLCRGLYRDKTRPVLINNWEATYFDFDEEKIVNIAKSAKELGVELMVLDDGWFRKYDNDECSLGDWVSNKRKLPNGIEGLAKKINELGMDFGLWFEPEMVSPDSDLYRAHPDWALHTSTKSQSQGRNQYILDLSRDDVCDYIIGFMRKILNNVPIAYIKWDMNRNMSDVGSSKYEPERQQEIAHRYMLGLYNILETLTSEFPNVLFEGCAGGGGRFDLGMFYYYPQYWTSDNSDAVDRMFIQYGSSMLYPTSVMGAHVSAVPNHQLMRFTPLKTRGDMASLGRFGYELDLAKLSTEEKETVKEQIKFYKKWESVIHSADMYRLLSPYETNHFAVEFLSEDKKYIIVVYTSILGRPCPERNALHLMGLSASAKYKRLDTESVYYGDVLENIGITLQNKGDFTSQIVIFEKQ